MTSSSSSPIQQQQQQQQQLDYQSNLEQTDHHHHHHYHHHKKSRRRKAVHVVPDISPMTPYTKRPRRSLVTPTRQQQTQPQPQSQPQPQPHHNQQLTATGTTTTTTISTANDNHTANTIPSIPHPHQNNIDNNKNVTTTIPATNVPSPTNSYCGCFFTLNNRTDRKRIHPVRIFDTVCENCAQQNMYHTNLHPDYLNYIIHSLQSNPVPLQSQLIPQQQQQQQLLAKKQKQQTTLTSTTITTPASSSSSSASSLLSSLKNTTCSKSRHSNHDGFNVRSREFIVNYLAFISYNLQLRAQTYAIAVRLFDEMICLRLVGRKRAIFLSLSCLFIASKLEELCEIQAHNLSSLLLICYEKNKPMFKDWCSSSIPNIDSNSRQQNSCYIVKLILAGERYVLDRLSYDVSKKTSFNVISCIAFRAANFCNHSDVEIRECATFIILVGLLDIHVSGLSIASIVIAATRIALCVNGVGPYPLKEWCHISNVEHAVVSLVSAWLAIKDDGKHHGGYERTVVQRMNEIADLFKHSELKLRALADKVYEEFETLRKHRKDDKQQQEQTKTKDRMEYGRHSESPTPTTATTVLHQLDEDEDDDDEVIIVAENIKSKHIQNKRKVEDDDIGTSLTGRRNKRRECN